MAEDTFTVGAGGGVVGGAGAIGAGASDGGGGGGGPVVGAGAFVAKASYLPLSFGALALRALRAIGVVGKGFPIQPEDLLVVFDLQRDIFEAMAVNRLNVYQSIRYEFNLLDARGGVDGPYSIGIGAEIEVPRPTWIAAAGLVLNRSVADNSRFERMISVWSAEQWQRISTKMLVGGLPSGIYYDGRFDNDGDAQGWGDLYVAPMPSPGADLAISLYLPTPMTPYESLTEVRLFPPGYARLILALLIERCAIDYQKPLTDDQREMIRQAKAGVEATNIRPTTIRATSGLPMSAVSSRGRRRGYDWRVGK